MKWHKREVEFNGEIRPLSEWRDTLGIKTVSTWCLYQRIFRYKWPPQKAFIDKKIGRGLTDPNLIFRRQSKEERINEVVDTVQLMMLARGYFRKINKIKAYKQLNGWYKEFRAQDMKAA